MIKKMIVGTLIFSVSLLAEVDLSKSENVDKIGLASLKENIEQVDKRFAGRWYLKNGKSSTYKSVKNDEFELEDAVNISYQELLNEIKKNQSFIGKTSSFMVMTKFDKYDFEGKFFPLENILTNDITVPRYGKHIVGNAGYHLKIKFDNTNAMHNRLPFLKDKAKAFLKSRKYSSGTVNRTIGLKYYYTIKTILPSSVDGINSCKENFEDCNILKTVLIGHINKIEIIDTKGEGARSTLINKRKKEARGYTMRKNHTVLYTYPEYK